MVQLSQFACVRAGISATIAAMKTSAVLAAPVHGAWVKPGALPTSLIQIAVASLSIALCAQVEIRLPFTPVPITAQTLAVALTGMTLGSRKGAAAVLVYLLEGCCGLPVFSGGASGLHHLAGPTGGYLAGFVLSAASAGALCERGWDRSPLRASLALLLSSLWVLIPGMLVLSSYVGGIESAFRTGVLPFLPGDIVKCTIAALALPWVRPAIERRRP